MVPASDTLLMNSKRNARSALAVYCVNAREHYRRVFLQMNPKIRTAKMI